MRQSNAVTINADVLSVIIVNHNTGSNLSQCVQSLLAETKQDVSLELIIIDNASMDDSLLQLPKELRREQVVIHNPKNVGFAVACNQGLKRASGGNLLLLNPDTVILPRAIQDSLAFLIQTPEAGIVGCRQLDTQGQPRNTCRTFPTALDYLFDSLFLTKIFPRSRLFGRFYLTNQAFDGPTEVDVVNGAFLMFKRSLMDDIGLLDERYFMYTEERDYCYRAKLAGWKIYYYPLAEIVHEGGVSTRQRALEMFVEQRKSMLLFHKKYDSRSRVLLIRIYLFLGIFLRFVAWNIIAVAQKSPEHRSRQHIYSGATLWFLGLHDPTKLRTSVGNSFSRNRTTRDADVDEIP